MHVLRLAVLAAAVVTVSCTSLGSGAGRVDVRAEAYDGGGVRYDGRYYDFRAANGIQQVKMWVPPTAETLKGALFHGNPGGYGDTRDIPRDRRLQEYAARHDFAIIGVTSFPGRRVYPDLAEVIVRAMDDWAALGHHPEIANLPLIARGSSNAGVTAYSLACYVPDRMICFTPNVGPRYNPATPPEEALAVPALMHVGPQDPFFRNGVESTRELFADARPRGARWAWDAEKDKGHEIGHIDPVDMKYYETCIRLRLPEEADGREGPVDLKTIPLEDGWLADPTSWDSALTRIAPWDEYEGDREAAVWLPDADTAFLYRSIATHDTPLKLSLRDLGPVDNPHESGVLLRSVGGRVIDPNSRVVVECDASGFEGWERIEFYDGANLIDTVERGEEPAVELVVQPERRVYSLSALGRGEDGTVRASKPVYFIVRDPELSAAIDAQHAAHDRVPPRGPRPAYGSSAEDASAVAPAPDSDFQVLTAYGLTPEQEKTFGAGDGPSPFWDDFTEGHDAVVMTVAGNLAEQGEVWEGAREQDDAQLTVRAARSRAGLYLLFEVEDDQWAPAEGLLDTLDFHLARRSADQIWDADPADVFVKPESWAFALSGCQYQFHVGDGERKVCRNWPDPWDVARREVSPEEAAETYGIVARVVELASDRRAVEMFIPWDWVGSGGPMDEPQTGTCLGLSLGYNDHDPDEHGDGQFARLRWNSRLDPWWRAGDEGPNPSPWGNLCMGPILTE
ncbi:MAG: hypothetical protein R6X33_14075 [Candidatus Brocadiia bacterium]